MSRVSETEELRRTIIDLIKHEHEEEWFEFKTNFISDHEIGEYISAISNAAAMKGQKTGYLVWGIDNKTHNFTGTKFNFHKDVKNEPLQHYLARQMKPDIGFSFHELQMDGNRVVVLVVPVAEKIPVSFDGVRYIRIGSSKENLTKYPERESQLFSVLRHGFPTIENTESKYQDLTFNKLFVYYESKGVMLNRKTFKNNLGLLTENRKYNLLAQLLSDNSRIPIRFALFEGENKASTMYSVKEFGNTCLLYSLDDVLRFGDLLNIPQADERERIVERKEVPLFHQEAYREAVINAFVHNNWIEGNAPMFTGYRNRLEILSRGKLPAGQTKEGFFAGESVPVNPALSKIFVQLHITEHTGRGVPRIIEAYGSDNIQFRENSIMVTIPYERIGEYVPVNTQVGGINAQVGGINAQVVGINVQENAQVNDQNAQVVDESRVHVMNNENSKGVSIEEQIHIFCVQPKSMREISEQLGFKSRRTTSKYLQSLINMGRIAMTIPDKPNSSKQKYIAIK